MIRLRVISTALVINLALVAQNKYHAQDLERITRLDGTRQRNALRVFLADLPGEHELIASIIYHETRLRNPLRRLLRDSKVSDQARELLALIGVQQDLHLVLRLPPSSKVKDLDYRWAYGVVCALVEPSSDHDWSFLTAAAFNEYDDRWVDAGAIQTLKLIASPRTRQILVAAREQNPQRVDLIAEAISYIDSGPAPLEDADLEKLAGRVAQAVRTGSWAGNKPPWYSRAGDKAVIDLAFTAGRDGLIYTATFHRTHAIWIFRGLRETLQWYLPPAPSTMAVRALFFQPILQLPLHPHHTDLLGNRP